MALADSGALSEAPGVKRSGSFLVNIHFFANLKKQLHNYIYIQNLNPNPKRESQETAVVRTTASIAEMTRIWQIVRALARIPIANIQTY